MWWVAHHAWRLFCLSRFLNSPKHPLPNRCQDIDCISTYWRPVRSRQLLSRYIQWRSKNPYGSFHSKRAWNRKFDMKVFQVWLLSGNPLGNRYPPVLGCSVGSSTSVSPGAGGGSWLGQGQGGQEVEVLGERYGRRGRKGWHQSWIGKR